MYRTIHVTKHIYLGACNAHVSIVCMNHMYRTLLITYLRNCMCRLCAACMRRLYKTIHVPKHILVNLHVSIVCVAPNRWHTIVHATVCDTIRTN